MYTNKLQWSVKSTKTKICMLQGQFGQNFLNYLQFSCIYLLFLLTNPADPHPNMYPTHIIDFQFSSKWCEIVAQALASDKFQSQPNHHSTRPWESYTDLFGTHLLYPIQWGAWTSMVLPKNVFLRILLLQDIYFIDSKRKRKNNLWLNKSETRSNTESPFWRITRCTDMQASWEVLHQGSSFYIV